MPLAPGTRIGSFEILAPLGAGGMGEVYRAKDSKLKRDVALKVLPEAFAEDPERLARFRREAEVLAALNHPNIAQIYGVEDRALVMELVEGESPKGPLPFDEAWKIASQIAAALEYAHERGIIHRDLKPANIKVTSAGMVKLLDFGLAKAFQGAPEQPGSDPANSPTLTLGATVAGTILGTAAYMSPEQAKGKPVDKRADIWAFGVVLYELLTGRRMFKGETSAETLAAVIEREPSWDGIDEKALTLLRRCLDKDPKRRLRDIGEAAAWVEQAPGAMTHSRGPRHGLWIAAAVSAVLAAAAVLIWAPWRRPPESEVMRFQIPLPDNAPFISTLSLSPDGHKLVYTAGGAQSGLWVRDLAALEWRRLPGTENAGEPFWSPDSRFLGFTLGNQLKKIDATGGPQQTLYSAPEPVVGMGAWNRDDVIVFGGPARNRIRRVSASGGVAVDLTAPDANDQGLPTFLPDGKHFLYLRDGPTEISGIYAGSLDATPSAQPRQRILAAQFGAFYTDGYLFVLRENTLMAQSFDAGGLRLRGDPVPLAEHVSYYGGIPCFSVSPSGVLIYRTGVAATANSQLTWFDRQGKRISTFGEPDSVQGIVLSPDGTRATVDRPTGDIWRLDFARGTSTRLTFRQVNLSRAVWSPDGNRIIFAAGNFLEAFFEKASSGAGEEKELFKKVEAPRQPSSWSRDGRFLLYDTTIRPGLWLLPLEGDRKPVLLLGTQFSEAQGRFSPDTRWIAYTSNETGRDEIYVRPFTPVGPSGPSLGEGKWQISKGGGSDPHWRLDGKELIFRAPDGSPMAVDVNGSGVEFQVKIPQQLFAAPPGVGDWDVTGDGKRFLMAVASSRAAETPITVVLNWKALLKR